MPSTTPTGPAPILEELAATTRDLEAMRRRHQAEREQRAHDQARAHFRHARHSLLPGKE